MMSRYSLSEIRNEIECLAKRIDAPDSALPTYGYSEQSGRPAIEADEGGYHYVGAERGHEFERITTQSIDEILYQVFRSVTHELASDYELQHRIQGKDSRELLFLRQIELLSLLSPQWATRRSEEVRKILERYPLRHS